MEINRYLKQSGFGLIAVLLIIGILLLTAGGVVGLPAVRQVWEKKVLPTSIIPSPIPTVPPTTPMSFSQLWQRRGDLLGQQVTVRGLVKFLVACSQGCASSEESPCGGCTMSIFLEQGGGVESIRLYRGGGLINCQWNWSSREERVCQGWDSDWEDGKEYLITGILGQDKDIFYLDVLSQQRR